MKWIGKQTRNSLKNDLRKIFKIKKTKIWEDI